MVIQSLFYTLRMGCCLTDSDNFVLIPTIFLKRQRSPGDEAKRWSQQSTLKIQSKRNSLVTPVTRPYSTTADPLKVRRQRVKKRESHKHSRTRRRETTASQWTRLIQPHRLTAGLRWSRVMELRSRRKIRGRLPGSKFD